MWTLLLIFWKIPLFMKGVISNVCITLYWQEKFTALNSKNWICLIYWAIISSITINFSYFGASLKIFSNAFMGTSYDLGFTKPFHELQCILRKSLFLSMGRALWCYLHPCLPKMQKFRVPFGFLESY